MPKILRAYYDFRGGLNTDAAIDNLADNELEQADNIVLLERGGIVKRKGSRRINATSYNEPVEQLIEWPRDDGRVQLLAIVGNKLCEVDEEDGSITPVCTVASRRIGYFFLQDRMYFVDGSEFRVYDGSTVERVEPSVRYGTAQVRGGGAISLSWKVEDDDARHGSRTTEGESGPAPTLPEIPYKNLEHIRRCKYVIRHPNSYRIFAAGDSENISALYYSEPGDPGHWKPTSVLYPVTGEGPILGLAIFGDALLAFYRRSIWAWRGIDPDADATWFRLPTGVGTSSDKSIALTPGTLTFLSDDGIYCISPAILGFNVALQPTEGMVLNLAKNKVQNLIRSIAKPEEAVGVYDPHRGRYLLAYTEPGAERNTKILVYDWSIHAFTVYTNLQVNDFLARPDGTLLAATYGHILQLEVGDSDDGNPIPMVVKTKQYNLDAPFHKKRIFRLYMSFRQPEQDTSIVTLRLYVDGTLENEIENSHVYENFVWGKSDWGAIWGFRDQVTTRSRISAGGHRVQVEFINLQADVPTTIYGLAFEYRPVRAKGMRL